MSRKIVWQILITKDCQYAEISWANAKLGRLPWSYGDYVISGIEFNGSICVTSAHIRLKITPIIT